MIVHVVRALARAFIGGGGGECVYLYICVMPDEILLNEKGEFFDSYGYPPEHYGFKSYKIETWNKHKLQSSWSNVCGQYCIFYLYHKSRGYSMSKTVNLFTDNTSINDCNVACYVKKHFNVVIENQPVCGLNQCCTPLFK